MAMFSYSSLLLVDKLCPLSPAELEVSQLLERPCHVPLLTCLLGRFFPPCHLFLFPSPLLCSGLCAVCRACFWVCPSKLGRCLPCLSLRLLRLRLVIFSLSLLRLRRLRPEFLFLALRGLWL